MNRSQFATILSSVALVTLIPCMQIGCSDDDSSSPASNDAGVDSTGNGGKAGASGKAGSAGHAAGAAGKGGAATGGSSGHGGTGGSGGTTAGGSGGTSAGGTSAGGTSAGGTSAGGTSAGGTSAGGTSAGGTSAGGTSAGGTSTGGSGGTNTGGNTGDPTAICARWKADRADMQEGTWTGGDIDTCVAGDIAPPGRENTVKLINLYRWLAKLPPVDHDATRDSKAQQCALMVSINGLNHNPPSSWKCYTAEGAEAAGQSNEAGSSSVSSIDMYIGDWGNTTTIGHRRWLLSNALGPVGVGSVNASCLWVIGGSGSGNNAWTAYPPPGPVPSEATSLADSTGWSIQSDSVSLAGASVKITDGGADQPVTVKQLLGGYGSAQAISILLNGWTAQVGHTYHVSVTGASAPIEYDVQPISCP